MPEIEEPLPRPSGLSQADALKYGVRHWMAACDYWQEKARQEKDRFRRLPFVGRTRIETLLLIRKAYVKYLTLRHAPRTSPACGGDMSVLDEGQAEVLLWYRRAHYFETRAKVYGAVSTKFTKVPPLRLLGWIWENTVVRARMTRTKRLLEALDHAGPARPRSGPDLVSVITPTHNRAYCINRAMNSLLRQGYGNWELIVVDDGSTDNTPEVMAGYKDERITYLRIPKSGVSRARNVGLDLAKGRYVTFLDSDNILAPDFLEGMHGAISASPDDVGMVFCDCRMYVDNLPDSVLPEEEPTPYKLFWKPLIDLGMIMCRREVFDGGLRFNEAMDKWVDYELMLRIIRKWRFTHLKKALLSYFRLQDGITLARYTERDMTLNMKQINKTKAGMLRVGYVLWDYPALSQSFVHSEIKWLLGHGVDVKVYYKAAPDKAAVLDYEVDSYVVRDADELSKLVQEHRRHLLHSHFAYPAATLLAWPAAKKSGLAFTVMPHAVDIFHYDNIKRNRLGEMAGSALCKALFAYGPFHRDFFVEHGVPAGKVVIKPNSLEPHWFDEDMSISGRPVRKAVYIGRLVEKKGVLDMIAAARRVSDLDMVFDIYGYGPQEEAVMKAADGAGNVRLHLGGLPRSEVKGVMREADLFFLPCIRAKNGDMDGLPTVIMEAAAIGLPVLTTGLSSIPVLMEDGVTGFVCPPGDIACFEGKLRWLAGRSPSEFAEVIRAARRRVLDNCGPEVVNGRLLETWLS